MMSAFVDDDVIMAAILGYLANFLNFFKSFQLERLQCYFCNGELPIAQMTSFKLANFSQNITPKSLIR